MVLLETEPVLIISLNLRAKSFFGSQLFSAMRVIWTVI
jgi:hypothetical protein